MHRPICVLLLLLSCCVGQEIPPKITSAKRILAIVAGDGTQTQKDDVLSRVKKEFAKWKRFQIVDSIGDADLVMVVRTEWVEFRPSGMQMVGMALAQTSASTGDSIKGNQPTTCDGTLTRQPGSNTATLEAQCIYPAKTEGTKLPPLPTGYALGGRLGFFDAFEVMSQSNPSILYFVEAHGSGNYPLLDAVKTFEKKMH